MQVPSFPRIIRLYTPGLILLFLFVGGVGTADPGKTFLEVRAALVAKHDRNGDGQLDEEEREAMRAQAKQSRPQNSRRRGGWNPPTEWLERYDADGDGELSRMEQGAAFAGEQLRMTKKYDADKNGRLEASEKAAIKKDFESGAFDGFDRFIAMQLGDIARPERRGRRGQGGFSQAQQRWLQFDADGDGKASAAELQAIRESTR